MARGLLSKAVRGAAQAGVPMLMEQHRAQIQAQRDANLQALSSKYRQQDIDREERHRAEDKAHQKSMVESKTEAKDYKVPDYEKFFDQKARSSFGKELSDGNFSFDDDVARDNAAIVSARAVDIFKENPGQGENKAWNKALSEFKQGKESEADDKLLREESALKADEVVNKKANMFLPDFLDPNIEGSREEMKAKEAEKLYTQAKGLPPLKSRTVGVTKIQTPRGELVWNGKGWEPSGQ